MRQIKIIVLSLIFLLLPITVFAALTINEIYPAPAVGDHEWVELYNNGPDNVDLGQYQLNDLAGNKINLGNQSLAPFGFAIATSSAVLNNGGDTLFLKTIKNELIETATYSGTFSSDKTYARCPDGTGSWFTLNLATKLSSNLSACLVLTPTQTPTPIPQDTPTPEPTPTETPTLSPAATVTQTPISYDNIYLSEVYSNPPIGEKEWVEFYNANDFAVSLKNWYIDDLENGGSSPRLFSLDIAANSYAVFELTSSIFNNDGDTVRLLDFNKNQKDGFEYLGGEPGKSWGRIDFESDEYCRQEPSKNTINNACLDQASDETTKVTSSAPTGRPTTYTRISTPTQKIFSNTRAIYPPVKILPDPAGQILGEMKHSTPKKQAITRQNFPKSILFIAFSNSLLTIGSILLKIKVYEAFKSFY